MVYSRGYTIFLNSIDVSNKIKNHKYISKLLEDIIKDMEKDNVVQIVTNNGFAFVKVEKKNL